MLQLKFYYSRPTIIEHLKLKPDGTFFLVRESHFTIAITRHDISRWFFNPLTAKLCDWNLPPPPPLEAVSRWRDPQVGDNYLALSNYKAVIKPKNRAD